MLKLIESKQENLHKLIQWNFEDLMEMKREYHQAYKDTQSEFIWEKLSQVDEAITIKIGNEEQAWDYLT